MSGLDRGDAWPRGDRKRSAGGDCRANRLICFDGMPDLACDEAPASQLVKRDASRAAPQNADLIPARRPW
jgi:hypothetical protein